MATLWWKMTKIFISKASFFVLTVSIIDYLILFMFNSFANNFITSFFSIKYVLVIALISGVLHILVKE